MRHKIIYTIVLMFCITGCGQNLKPENKSKIMEVSVSSTVKMPKQPGFIGHKQAISGAAFGVLGAVVSHSLAKNERDEIQEYLKQQKIDVGEIVRNTFIKGLQIHPFFANKLKDTTTTHFELEVKSYGLVLEPWSLTMYKPILAVKGKLIDNSGAVIWEKEEGITQLNDVTPSFTYEDYFKSPDAFRKAFSVASEEVVKLLIEQIN